LKIPLTAFAAAAVIIAVTALPSVGMAQSTGWDRPIDRIVVLIETSSSDGGASVPVLTSDIALQVRLDMVGIGGSDWRSVPVDDRMVRGALRTIVLTRWAARQARQMGVETNRQQRAAARSKLLETIGGHDRMSRLLGEVGADMDDLDRWIDDRSLATEQMEYLRERIEPPTDKALAGAFAAGGHPFAGRDPADVRAAFKRYYMDRLVRSELTILLDEAINDGSIRFLE